MIEHHLRKLMYIGIMTLKCIGISDIEILLFCANDICIPEIWTSRLSSCVLGTSYFSKRKWDSIKHNLEHIIQWSKRWMFIVGTLPGFVEWLEECCQARVYFLPYIQSVSFSETTITAPMCLPNPQVLISCSGPSPLVGGGHPVMCYVTGWDHNRADVEGSLSNSGLCLMVNLPGASKTCQASKKCLLWWSSLAPG